MRRLRCGAAALLASATALAGCGAPSSEAGGRQTVTMWTYPVIFDPAANAKYWDGLTAAFEKQHPGIRVHVETFPWANRDTALATSIAGGKQPDVVYVIPDQIPKLRDSIVPADRYLPPSELHDFTPMALRSVTTGGHPMAAPVLTSANALICNKKVFRAIGEDGRYPATWKQLADLAPKLKAKGYYALSYSGDTEQSLNLTFYPALWQAGGDVFTKSTTNPKPAFDSPAAVRALSRLRTFVARGWTDRDLVTTTPALEQTPVARGKVACTWQNTPADMTPFWGKQNIAVLPPLKDARATGYGTTGALAVLDRGDAKAQSAAGKWVRFASSARNAAGLEQPSGNFPARRSAPELYAKDPLMKAVEKTLPQMDAGPMQPRAREVMGLLAPQIQAALLGRTSPKDALREAADAAAELH